MRLQKVKITQMISVTSKSQNKDLEGGNRRQVGLLS